MTGSRSAGRARVCLFSAGMFLAAASLWTGPPAADCLSCHKDAAVSGSIHAKLKCVDCHQGLKPVTGTPPHQSAKAMPPPSCSPACHKAVRPAPSDADPGAYADSIHGQGALVRSEKEAARCWDCHGRHAIKPASDPASPVARANIPLTCSRCHEDMAVVLRYNIHAEAPYAEYLKSVHGKALRGQGSASFAAVCTDCHGAHAIQPAGQPGLRAKNPETCGRCHVRVLETYKAGIHGREALRGNPDVPTCVDCHGEHGLAAAGTAGSPTAKSRITDTCASCHAKPDVMKRYGVPADRVSTFITSLHGISAGLGDTAGASCADCHGFHDIRPAADPLSSVSPAKLAATCGRPGCHPGMPARIASAKIHRDAGDPAGGAPYIVQKALIWLLLASLAGTLVWFVPVLIRRAGGGAKR